MDIKEKPALTYALGQIDVVPGRPDINSARIIKEATAAATRGVDVIIFSEMSVPGYLIGDRWNSNGFAEDIAACNERIVASTADHDTVVIFGSLGLDTSRVNENGKHRKYNAALVAQGGRLVPNDAGLPYAIKTLHPNYRIFDDARYFHCLRKLALERGQELRELLQPFTLTIRGHEYRLGVMLCEDMWENDYVETPSLILKVNGAEVLINVSCSNWSWRKNQKRHRVVRDIIAETGLPFLYVNNVGCQNTGKNFIPFDGSSTVYNARGEIVFLAGMYEDRVRDIVLTPDLPAIEEPQRSDAEEMYLAIKASTLGFLRTTHPRHRRRVVIGVSGGIDSMLSAAFFVHLLGPEKVTLVNMPMSGHSSPETIAIAKCGAENLKVALRTVPIDEMVAADMAATGIETGTPQHKTVQAAMRFKVLASIASQEGGLIIANGNKTELAFGYATLIGDLRGYFAPWMDCLKSEVYQLADHLNREVFGREVIPPECFSIAPMDELSPMDAGAPRRDPFDFGHVDRMGYHDAMVRSLVELQKEPAWFLEGYRDGTLEAAMLLSPGRLAELFPTVEAFVEDLEEKLRMFHGAIHKRVQSVPGAHFSRSSFGWDFREYLPVVSDGVSEEAPPPYYGRRYETLKAELLDS